MSEHLIMGDKVRLYKRGKTGIWQCYTHLDGKAFRKSTDLESLAAAKEFAEDWYLELRGKQRAGQLEVGITFRTAASQFLREFEALTKGKRNPVYVRNHRARLDNYLLPFFGDMLVTKINAGTGQEYRIDRIEKSLPEKPPARSTLHHEFVVLRQVLKTAERHGWITAVPNLSPPFKESEKITHRAWFSPEEYRSLYKTTRHRTEFPVRPRWKHSYQQLHDYVLFMANTGLRPDEAARLEYRDVKIAWDESTRETILEIEVRGKRGIGLCKSTAGAVLPFKRLKTRNKPKPTDRLFYKSHRTLFNTILSELGLKFDREGNRRTAYSLRHTYICLRLMEGADIYQISKNCRTSVEMIEKHYAVHLKNTLDASAINVRRKKPTRDSIRRDGKHRNSSRPPAKNPVGDEDDMR